MATTNMTEKTIEELVAEIAELHSEKERLEHQIEILQKTIFGSRSEKKVLKTEPENDAQMSLFDEAETECKKEEIKEEIKEETVTVPEHTRKKKRSRDMIMKYLPVEEVVHKVEDSVCDKYVITKTLCP